MGILFTKSLKDDKINLELKLKDDDIIDITISDYLKLSNTVKKNLSIFKVDNIHHFNCNECHKFLPGARG